MRCPRCAQENRTDRRFCAGCGARLPLPCPACGFANEAEARFCGGCGADMSAPVPAPRAVGDGTSGERRQVTVLFADLAGYTRLSRTLDAEELHAIMARFFDAVDRVVASYGGSVDKHIGDAVMAVFGAPVAHGDDPLRAARAAVEIHEAVTALGRQLGQPLGVHIGIASGEVVAAGLGSERHSEYTVIGDAVNLAARLVDMAESGATLISDPVRRAAGPGLEVAALGEVVLRGLDAPVRVWRLDGLHGDTAASTPFVGRLAERSQIAGMLETCRSSGRGKALLLRGEAGIGKTRLVEEIAATARARGFDVHLARVLDFGTATGRDAARVLARSLLGVDGSGDETLRLQAADRALGENGIGPDRRPFLLDLLDLPQPLAERAVYDAMDNATRNLGKQQTLAALLALAARSNPLLVAVEDIHWADPPMLAHLARLTVALSQIPAVLVMTTRIEGDPLTESWRAGTRANPLVTIDLGPLAPDEAMALAGSFLDATDRIALACVERADGNPLFLEQLLRHAEASEESSVPATIQSLVLGRMDRLPPADRAALQAASVVGQHFTLDLLRHLLGDDRYDAAGLVARHLARPEQDGYLFAHALVRDGVYGALLRQRRRELHRRAAEWFAARDAGLAAQHLDRAEDPGAAAAYLKAARQQAAGYHNDRALALVERGLAIATDTADQHALVCLRGELLHDLGRIAESVEAFREAVAMAQTEAERCQAWTGLAAGLRVADRYDEALEMLDRAEASAAARSNDLELARIHNLRGNVFFPLGRIEDCRRAHELSLDHARAAGSPESEARALSGLGDACYAAGRMLSAGDYFGRCIALASAHGLGRIEVANRSMAALSRLYACDLDTALSQARATVEMASRVGHQRADMISSEITYLILREIGDMDAAEPHARRALELSRKLGARRFEAEDLTFLAQVARDRGERGEALRLLEAALAISREVGMRYIGALILGEIAAATDDAERRAAALAEGEAHLHRGSVSHAHLWFYQVAIEVHLEHGDWAGAERAARALRDYARPEPMPWSDFYAARGTALAAWGMGGPAPALLPELRRLAADAARYRLGRARVALDRIVAAA